MTTTTATIFTPDTITPEKSAPDSPLLVIQTLIREYVDQLPRMTRIGPQTVFVAWLEWLEQREKRGGGR